MTEEVELIEHKLCADGNARMQPVAALPSRKPIRRGIRTARSSTDNSDQSSNQTSSKAATSSLAALYSGIHGAAASSEADAVKRLTELEEEQVVESSDNVVMTFGRSKKRRFSIGAHSDTSSAFAPYQSVDGANEEEELQYLTPKENANGVATRVESRSPTPPPIFDASRYVASSSTSNDFRNLNTTLGALKHVAVPTEADILPVPDQAVVVAAQTDLCVKIRHKAAICRVTLPKTALVAELVKQFAASFKLPAHLVTLWRSEDALAPDDTLQKAGVVLTDILDCTISSEETIGLDGTLERNMVSLKVQDKSKSYTFSVGKSQRLCSLMELYCKESGNDSSRVVLVFDGDKLDLTDTPASLDMDSGDVVDARLKA